MTNINTSDNKLGLPLEYQEMPEYFDSHNINEQTAVKNALIEKLLRSQRVSTVLDMTCGTGSQVFYLHQRGYQIIGSDFSPDLLKQACAKADKLNLDVRFVDGDMRDLSVGQFDAVITIFNAIGHLSKADFKVALKNIASNLNDGGIYVFDILNLEALNDDVIDSFSMSIENNINDTRIHNTQYSELDRGRGLLHSHDKYVISQDGSEPRQYTNSFSLQLYTADELNQTLSECGFKVLEQYDMEGNLFVANKSQSILTVAKKRT